MRHVLALTLIIAASSPVAALDPSPTPVVISSDAGTKQPPDRAPSLMTRGEIEAYNKGLARNHPYYITCRKDPVMGSLSKKLRVCRTNEQWKGFAARGNDEGHAIMDEMSHAPVNSGAGGPY
jgi:hypothetical protein